jgi:hypothetical protein
VEASQLDPTQVRALMQNSDGTYTALLRNGARIKGIPHTEGQILAKVLNRVERETFGPRETD